MARPKKWASRREYRKHYMREYRLKTGNAFQKEYLKRNPEKAKLAAKKYRETHKEKLNAYQREYYKLKIKPSKINNK